jgi:DNA-directed RNA polymerase specialized sigma24 family protein
MPGAMTTHLCGQHMRKARGAQNIARLDERFSSYYRLLHFTACRVLGSRERADLAVEKSWLAASFNPPKFDNEGAFRSWLFRILIDEALAILRKDLRIHRPTSLAMGYQP